MSEDEDLENYPPQNPIRRIQIDRLTELIKELHSRSFEKDGSVTLGELMEAAEHARFYNNHRQAASGRAAHRGHITGELRDGQDLGRRELAALQTQESKAFWSEPKDLLVTLLACCLASLTQGWDQVANGNLGWPAELGLDIGPDGTGTDVWKVGAVNAITWFAAALLGPWLVDPICQLKWFGRRGAVFIAAIFSFASMVGGSRASTWKGYFVCRLLLGIGIGGKASIVPIWESEILPPGKRGRLLVSWQLFTATGIFAGSVATYIFRDTWRNQVLSGAIPAFVLLIVTYLGCESPRWLLVHGKYIKAERRSSPKYKGARPEEGQRLERLSYKQQLHLLVSISRNLRAALSTMIVMLSQQLSGINILGFLASIFFTALQPKLRPEDGENQAMRTKKSLAFAIGFGAANAVFSAIAYFLVEPPEEEDDQIEDKRLSVTQIWQQKFQKLVFGRRSLLICSLGGSTLMLFILTFLLRLDKSDSAKLPIVMVFIILWTLFYSPGAGAIPFLYSAEVWPNEGREVGMSWAVFWNFLGSGLLALLVPQGLNWGPPKLFGLFTGLSFLGMLLVYFFVPGTDRAISLEDMHQKFSVKVRDFSKKRVAMLNPRRKKGGVAEETGQEMGVF